MPSRMQLHSIMCPHNMMHCAWTAFLPLVQWRYWWARNLYVRFCFEFESSIKLGLYRLGCDSLPLADHSSPFYAELIHETSPPLPLFVFTPWCLAKGQPYSLYADVDYEQLQLFGWWKRGSTAFVDWALWLVSSQTCVLNSELDISYCATPRKGIGQYHRIVLQKTKRGYVLLD